MKILGVDYGDRRTGLAACDVTETLSYPLTVLTHKSMRAAVEAVAGAARDEGAQLIVLGLPLNMDGTAGARADKTGAFGRVLERVTGIAVVYQDERLTSLLADERLAAAGVKKSKRKEKRDMAAAQCILEAYLNQKSRDKKTPQ
ncbi:MAG: Holliday junction resolvase RuvX [Clostridiales bacterium]|nr:Holliday junction resolvase RuvX [Clostridiales bacterium]